MRESETLPTWEDAQNHLMTLARGAIDSVDPYRTLKRHLRLENDQLHAGKHTIALNPESKVYVVGAGKAGVPMVKAANELLGTSITSGVVSVPDPPVESLAKIQLIRGGHPLPTSGSIHAGERIVELLEKTRGGDVVIALISGGGSALLELPRAGVDLASMQQTNELLLRRGVPIEEINTVRIQLSEIKGGGLLRHAAPATCIAFILSDVIGDDLGMVASGPTVHSSVGPDSLDILGKYDLRDKVPPAVLKALLSAVTRDLRARAVNVLIGNNLTALRAAETSAKDMGYVTLNLGTLLRGEARLAGTRIGSLANAIGSSLKVGDRPVCLILGGETVVTVRGNGSGGRNQEFALAACMQLDPARRIALLAIATDGVDGPTSAAGASITSATVQLAKSHGLDPPRYLEDNDSHTFFEEVGGCVITGPTQTNVNDIVVCIIHPL